MFCQDLPDGYHAKHMYQNKDYDKRDSIFLKNKSADQKNEQNKNSNEKSKGWNRAVGTCEYTGEVGQKYWNQRALNGQVVNKYASKKTPWQNVGTRCNAGVMGKIIKVFTTSEIARPVPVLEK